ncbi:FtsX-like permease family protein [Bifidobacterium pullorum subsp. gallinarum]|uniref:FtsX-like permease family protein n=1 Tax=Bifidobacterium pullorum subsp. gallinarum TaxID=78344 RepID=A0A4P6DU11_9BIFI|nr:ABC transporter permease [Bifidobacterium pullorum]QAY33176.1 FtsX-like permease family protein [Bifidobacterium pullorum subsp. gallinarum]
MHGAFAKIVRRSIRGSLGRFLAIIGIVALGCGFFAGLQMSGPDMRASADRYYDGTHLWDIRLISTLGFSDDDVQRVRDIEGIADAMPSISTDVMMQMGDEQAAVRIALLPDGAQDGEQTDEVTVASDDDEYLNRLLLRDGRWPTAEDECVVSADTAAGEPHIGQTIHVLYGTDALDGTLDSREFTVVGTVSSSNYPYTVSFGSTTLGSGMIEQYLYAPRDAFAVDAAYTEIYATVEGAGAHESGSDDYEQAVTRVTDRIERNADDLAATRLDDVKRPLQQELDERRATYETERDAAMAQLEQTAQQLDTAAQLNPVNGQIAAARAQLGQQQAQAEQQFADAEAQLADAQAEIDAMEPPELYVLDRTQSEGAASYQADSERMDSIADVFPAMFFLVAALVALTTMTRMVENERIEIGTYKALGYGTGTIACKYLAYAGAASVTGAVIGIAVLSQILPYIVMRAYAIIYAVPAPPLPLPIQPGAALLSGGLGVGVTLLCTWFAVVSSLRETPSRLMLPRPPKAGKRILLEHVGPLWRRMSFSWKVTCRNIFRYKRRFLMTLIGISGCTALMLVGFGLHDSIWDIIDNQFGTIQHYNTVVSLDANATDGDLESVRRMLREHDATELTRVDVQNMQVAGTDDADPLAVQVIVPQKAAALSDVITFRERVGHTSVAFDDDAVLVTEKAAATLGLHVGDELTLYRQDGMGNATGGGARARITGIVENYVGNMVYVGPEAWRQAAAQDDGMDAELAYRTTYAVTPDGQRARDDLSAALREVPHLSTVGFSAISIETYSTMLSSINLIVVVLIVSAAALAFIVLYNLTNINIGERVREIATLKVLGFTRGEVNAYIFREIAILSLVGDLFGLALGTWLEGFVITTVEVDVVMFGRIIHPLSYLYAFLLTLVFSAVVVLAMRGRLDRVDMVESLKSVD